MNVTLKFLHLFHPIRTYQPVNILLTALCAYVLQFRLPPLSQVWSNQHHLYILPSKPPQSTILDLQPDGFQQQIYISFETSKSSVCTTQCKQMWLWTRRPTQDRRLSWPEHTLKQTTVQSASHKTNRRRGRTRFSEVAQRVVTHDPAVVSHAVRATLRVHHLLLLVHRHLLLRQREVTYHTNTTHSWLLSNSATDSMLTKC